MRIPMEAVVAVEHHQLSCLSTKEWSLWFESTKGFKSIYKQRKGAVEGQVGIVGVFGADFSTTWNNVDHFVDNTEKTSLKIDFNEKHYQPGFLQVVRVVKTTIKLDGKSVEVKDREWIQSIQATNPCSQEQLKEWSQKYLEEHYGAFHIKNTTATKSMMVDVPEYVKDVHVVVHDRKTSPGENAIPMWGGGVLDLNKGMGGQYTYLVKTKTTNRNEAATGFKLERSKNAKSGKGRDYAEGAGGDHRYFITEKNGSNAIPWTAKIYLYRSTTAGANTGGQPWKRTGDLNEGRGGDFLYVLWRDEGHYKRSPQELRGEGVKGNPSKGTSECMNFGVVGFPIGTLSERECREMQQLFL